MMRKGRPNLLKIWYSKRDSLAIQLTYFNFFVHRCCSGSPLLLSHFLFRSQHHHFTTLLQTSALSFSRATLFLSCYSLSLVLLSFSRATLFLSCYSLSLVLLSFCPFHVVLQAEADLIASLGKKKDELACAPLMLDLTTCSQITERDYQTHLSGGRRRR